MERHKAQSTRSLISRLQDELAAKRKALDALSQQHELAVQRHTMLKEITRILELRLRWISDGNLQEDAVVRELLEQLEQSEQQPAVTSSSSDSSRVNSQSSNMPTKLFKYFHVGHYLHTTTSTAAVAHWQLDDLLAYYQRVQREMAFQLLQLPDTPQPWTSPGETVRYQLCTQAIALQYLECLAVLQNLHNCNKRQVLHTLITINLSTLTVDPQPPQIQAAILERMQLTEHQYKTISTGVRIMKSIMQPLSAVKQAITRQMGKLAEETQRVQQAATADSVDQKQLATLLSQQEELAQKCSIWERKEAMMYDFIAWLVLGQLSWKQIAIGIVHSHPYVFRPMLLGMEVLRQWDEQHPVGQQQMHALLGDPQRV